MIRVVPTGRHLRIKPATIPRRSRPPFQFEGGQVAGSLRVDGMMFWFWGEVKQEAAIGASAGSV